MTSGEDWQNGVKEESDNNEESMLVDVESHEDLPDMKREADDSFSDQSANVTMVKNQTPPDLREWLKHFRAQVLAPIFRNAKSGPFRKPVDAIALGIYPAYFEVVKTPMDLGTIRQKIEEGVYLKKEEVTTDLMLVWDNAMTFNQPEHFVHQTATELKAQCQSRLDKLERDGIPPPNTPKPLPVIQVKRDSLVRRDARKKSFDLPGEISTPQHLEQKYVSKLSSSLKACDHILKNLLSLKLHRDYVEPFINVDRKTESDAYQPMSLTKIQHRMRSLQYSHPMEFADDMRRIVTETYRYCHPEDPIVAAAAKLQQEFEMLFAKINFQENELVPTILAAGSDQLEDDDEYIGKLLSAQNFMVQIQTDLTELIKDYMRMKSKKNKKKKRKVVVTPSTSSSASRPLPAFPGPSPAVRPTPPTTTPSTPLARPVMQGQLVQRPSTSGKQFLKRPPAAESTPVQHQPPPKKKARTEPTPPPAAAASKPVLTLPEANALKQEISQLEPAHQFKVLEILQANGEEMAPDENGEVEIEIFRCSAKSVADVKAFLNFVKNQQKLKNSAAAAGGPSKSGKGKVLSRTTEAEKVSTLSDDSSSGSDSSSSASSSEDSSDSSSGSDDDDD